MGDTAHPDRVAIESDRLRAVVDPRVGGTIVSITHVGLGASVLGACPWDALPQPHESVAAPDERSWLTHYPGGWPLLFPNGGDACTFEGAFHGFHGEASVAPWRAEADRASVRLSRRFFTIPVEMHRAVSVAGDLLTIRETVRMLGPQPLRVMWTHHPTLGGDLLDGDFEISTAARSVTIDDVYDPLANPLQPGAKGAWPSVPGKRGTFDQSRPAGPMAATAYLHDFAAPWVAVRRLDDAVAVALSWDQAVFPCAWLWYELGGTPEAPWRGRARFLGVEPSSSWPGTGLADIARRGGRLLTLRPGDAIAAEIRLHVFKPKGSVRGVDGSGRAFL
jgi:hypothetical protein